MTKSTFSHHLRILREAGILTSASGHQGLHQLRKDDLDSRFPGLIDAIIDAEDQELSISNGRATPSSSSSATPS